MGKTSPSNAGSLVQEIRAHMPCGQKNQELKNRANVVTSSMKTLKMVHIKKKSYINKIPNKLYIKADACEVVGSV